MNQRKCDLNRNKVMNKFKMRQSMLAELNSKFSLSAQILEKME